jgi:hypothetical protein
MYGVDAEFAGDTFFPAISQGMARLDARAQRRKGAQPGSLFVVYEDEARTRQNLTARR